MSSGVFADDRGDRVEGVRVDGHLLGRLVHHQRPVMTVVHPALPGVAAVVQAGRVPDQRICARLCEDTGVERDAPVAAHALCGDGAEGDVRRQVRQGVRVGVGRLGDVDPLRDDQAAGAPLGHRVAHPVVATGTQTRRTPDQPVGAHLLEVAPHEVRGAVLGGVVGCPIGRGAEDDLERRVRGGQGVPERRRQPPVDVGVDVDLQDGRLDVEGRRARPLDEPAAAILKRADGVVALRRHGERGRCTRCPACRWGPWRARRGTCPRRPTARR